MLNSNHTEDQLAAYEYITDGIEKRDDTQREEIISQLQRYPVPLDGDVYAIFGMTRDEAYHLMLRHFDDDAIQALILPALHAALSTKDFIQNLREKAVISSRENDDTATEISEQQENFSHLERSEEALRAYIKYDILDKKVDSGWPHLGILQAVAHLQGTELHLWRKKLDVEPIAYERYQEYVPKGAFRKIDLLSLEGNRIERFKPPIEGLQETLTFLPVNMPSEADASYAAFGITRPEAYDLMRSHLNDDVKRLIIPAVRTALATNSFIQYLREQKLISSETNITDSTSLAADEKIIRAYI